MLTEFIGWVLNTLTTAAEAEMNDDTALREQLLDAEMRREMGEISDQEFETIEADLLARIREIKGRREGGAGPLSMGSQPIEATGESRFQIEASVSGDFHDPASAPHTTIVETEPGRSEQIAVLDMESGQAESRPDAGLPLEHRPAKHRRRSSPARRKLRTS